MILPIPTIKLYSRQIRRVFPCTTKPQFYKITLLMHKINIRSLNATASDANQSETASIVGTSSGC